MFRGECASVDGSEQAGAQAGNVRAEATEGRRGFCLNHWTVAFRLCAGEGAPPEPQGRRSVEVNSHGEWMRQADDHAVWYSRPGTMDTGSVEFVRWALQQRAAGLWPDDADGPLAAHVVKLSRRVRHLRRRGHLYAHVRLAPDIVALRAASETSRARGCTVATDG